MNPGPATTPHKPLKPFPYFYNIQDLAQYGFSRL